jgi:DNA-binding protein H-NS
MARPKNLSLLSVDDLLKLHDEVTAVLDRKASELRSQISRLGGGAADNGAWRGRRGSVLKGRKVAPKYRSKRDPKLTWAGRGATPRWMREEMKAKKLKKEAFLIK